MSSSLANRAIYKETHGFVPFLSAYIYPNKYRQAEERKNYPHEVDATYRICLWVPFSKKTWNNKGEHVKNSDRKMKAARVSAFHQHMLVRKRLVVKTHLSYSV